MKQVRLCNNPKKIAIGALLLFLLLSLCYLLIGQRLSAPGAGGMLLQIDDDAVPYAGAPPVDQSGGSPGIKIPGYGSVTVPANETQVTVPLLNPDGNPCYFTFELVLAESGESLYSSGLVEPAMCIEQLSLIKPLETGEYPLTIRIRTYSLQDMTPMNNANVQTVLKVV